MTSVRVFTEQTSYCISTSNSSHILPHKSRNEGVFGFAIPRNSVRTNAVKFNEPGEVGYVGGAGDEKRRNRLGISEED